MKSSRCPQLRQLAPVRGVRRPGPRGGRDARDRQRGGAQPPGQSPSFRQTLQQRGQVPVCPRRGWRGTAGRWASRVLRPFQNSPMARWPSGFPVPNDFWVALPDGLDDVTAAAVANPGMSSWAALTARAKLVPGETVLINGATGSAGRLAVQIAKHLGAKKVIVTGRSSSRLDALPVLGADEVIPLELPEEERDRRLRQEFQHRGGCGPGLSVGKVRRADHRGHPRRRPPGGAADSLRPDRGPSVGRRSPCRGPPSAAPGWNSSVVGWGASPTRSSSLSSAR